MRRLAAVAGAVLVVAAQAVSTIAAPTCPNPATQPACGNRVVPEPLLTATFLQYGAEAFPALEAIEAIAPDLIEVYTLDELTGNDEHVSAGGLKIPVIRVTDEAKTGPKKKVAISLSVHANESAGREGGFRYLEDLARWWVADKEHPLYAGEVALPLGDVMAQTESWWAVLNPDGWQSGDLGQPGTFIRGNDNGEDLNREFPTKGWTNEDATPMSEPEAKGWVEFVSSIAPVTTSTDIHGELTSANNAFADLMWPAGQWTPRMQEQEKQLGLNMIKNIERKFAEDNVVLGTLTGAGDQMSPAAAATGYDVVGYDDGGFMGDWFTQATGAVDIDAENFLSHLVPSNIWLGPLEQAHVAAVRGIIESVITEAVVTGSVKPSLSLGRVAYVDDPRRVTSADGTGGDPSKPYDVSRLDYFRDLATDAGVPVTALAAADIASGTVSLASYDTIVVADVPAPPDSRGRAYDQARYRAALAGFARGGGQLLLTDAAVPMVSSLGAGVDEAAVGDAVSNAGHVEFGELSHEWEEGLLETASQTYYEVPLGFSPINSAPHYGVGTSAWEDAGGTTVGTFGSGDSAMTTLGELPLGTGKIAIFGAVLPTPSEEETHHEGIIAYGVTIAGGQVLHNILGYRRPGVDVAPPVVNPPGENPPDESGPLPTTGADLTTTALPLLFLLAGAAVVRRRRAD